MSPQPDHAGNSEQNHDAKQQRVQPPDESTHGGEGAR